MVSAINVERTSKELQVMNKKELANGRIYVVEAAFLFYLGVWMEQTCKPSDGCLELRPNRRYSAPASGLFNGRFPSRTAPISAATICRYEITAMFCWGGGSTGRALTARCRSG